MYSYFIGKYLVRLHYAGCWRRILIDDTVPVDKDGRSLLPYTSNNFELWPMLLAKALLKVASLTWNGIREIVEFHPIACLTGRADFIISFSIIKEYYFQDILYFSRIYYSSRIISIIYSSICVVFKEQFSKRN